MQQNVQSNFLKSVVTLGKNLEEKFPYTNPEGVFETFLFSNERKHKFILEKILNNEFNPPYANTDKIKVVILFGESNILSFLPAINKCADLIILADIEPLTAKNTKHLLRCMEKSETRDNFLTVFSAEHPLKGLKKGYNQLGFELSLDESQGLQPIALGEHYFWASDEQYQKCKMALRNIAYCHIQLDLTSKEACESLSKCLHYNNALFSFCNFSNIHHYDKDNKLYDSVDALLKFSENCAIFNAPQKEIFIKAGQETFMMKPLESKNDIIASSRYVSSLKTFNSKKEYFQKIRIDRLTTCINKFSSRDNIFKNKHAKRLDVLAKKGDFNLFFRQCAVSPQTFEFFEYLLENTKKFNIDVFSKGITSGSALDIAEKFKNHKAYVALQNHIQQLNNQKLNQSDLSNPDAKVNRFSLS